ncbi:PAS domain-containing sensor histidine kinase [Xanthocytophaga agilis]|uniref:histidine kinase n=1 Tax=Xanthocytophaga agilis TaxID=3048010 RepID=A0AAE3UIU3_9BACT|nr:PAS domain-containing sensor histidine kinase [Xanthocytophaga agilis]MDJ1505816.1 PAS domain-containing sensor histidine kinase [Xanthocytophaga agilis]
MIEWIDLVDKRFMPHGHCYFWEPFVLWPYAISDSIIAIAYFSIPLALGYIYLKRKDFSYIWIVILFAVFICGCGITHIFDVVNIWRPLYKLDVIVRIITALASLGTAVVLIKITPKIIDIPSLDEWKDLNNQLQHANEELYAANEELQVQLEELRRKDKTIQAYKEFERLIESLPQLVWTTNPFIGEDTSIYINHNWYVYTGLSTHNDFDTIYSVCVPIEQQQAVKEHWQHCLQTHERFERELLLRRFDGQYRWHLSTAVYSVATNHWVGTFTDIHEQKLLSQKMEEMTQQLALSNQELLASNQSLEKVNEQLSRTNEELDQYVYKVSHDIRSPIASIMGLLGLINKEILPAQELQYLHLMENRINRLDDFIKSVLSHSRSLNTAVSMSPINFDKIIDQCLEELQYYPEVDQLHIKKELPQTGIFWGDELRLSIIFKNLISNAIKYRNKQVRSMLIISVSVSAQQAFIVLQDNGQGIPDQYQQQVFTMFFRATEKADGSGLGLYIVKQAVERMGGTITLQSQFGKGTAFTIQLPNQNYSHL